MTPSTETGRAASTRLVRDVPDFPEPGILFRDITPLLGDGPAFRSLVESLGRPHAGVDVVAGIEARGFILAAPLATRLGVGFVPVRKAGKLPGPTERASYALEYGEAMLEVTHDAIRPGQRVLLVDDVLATGGTAAAAAELVERAGRRGRRDPGADRAVRARRPRPAARPTRCWPPLTV